VRGPLAAVLAAGLIAGCGNGDDENASSTAPTATTAVPPAASTLPSHTTPAQPSPTTTTPYSTAPQAPGEGDGNGGAAAPPKGNGGTPAPSE
jgi:hypothetical protein